MVSALGRGRSLSGDGGGRRFGVSEGRGTGGRGRWLSPRKGRAVMMDAKKNTHSAYLLDGPGRPRHMHEPPSGAATKSTSSIFPESSSVASASSNGGLPALEWLESGSVIKSGLFGSLSIGCWLLADVQTLGQCIFFEAVDQKATGRPILAFPLAQSCQAAPCMWRGRPGPSRRCVKWIDCAKVWVDPVLSLEKGGERQGRQVRAGRQERGDAGNRGNWPRAQGGRQATLPKHCLPASLQPNSPSIPMSSHPFHVC